ncbi:outer membrane receptor for ferrienterochelin and colicin [Winogradskyella wandonensis]|uniref:Outer membrane receptor for ferrienterochelin and colicin n=1 Tax=Winogradskyella wandonensis TaxID=1442586 RepID=A0A4R1KSM3_9FLAO|nr:TonB-dependent receptor [Winogradskyella wandonensis]TCK67279.1 outer membrane receptor for ferrienterochelin and colicin [Winogradskyella wandonensis]
MKKMLSLIIFLALGISITAQETLSGIVLESVDTKEQPLPGANVYWLDTSVGTMTDEDGKFSIPYQKTYSKLVISYVGFKTDTLNVSSNTPIRHVLQSTSNLDQVTITSRKQATSRSYLKATNTFTVSSDELLKAACCNLSESFETNPSIDVNFADAVSGTKQIKMLGLTSPYILIATENVPAIRGAAQTYGLSFIPGTWVESIQITKGAGSVVNGYESISGQINAELQKPSNDSPFFLNAYGSVNGRLELNTHINTNVSEKWKTGFYIHGNIRNQEFDRNDDSFLDVPLKKQINVMNRWQYTDAEKGVVSFINVRYLNDNIQAGQINFNPDTDRGTTNAWGSEIDTERFEITTKLGYVNPEVPWQTIGFQTAFSYHNQQSYFGLNTYDIRHNSFYSNIIYNSIISDSRHKIKTGLSFTLDDYDEVVNATDFERIENSVGAFFEYAYDNLDKLTLTAGLRADAHNRFGFFITPRLHLRYTPWEKSAWRFSVGRGIRSANIFAENQNLFSSSRQINIQNSGGKIYGLDPEIAWNYGISYLQGFNLFGQKADITLDFYRTDFQNQVVVDWENPFEINFYNLEGDSFANSFQFEFNYNAFKGVDLRTAYKFYDVKTDYNSGRLERPLTPRHRLFANAAYETELTDRGKQWKFDLTYNWLSSQRFPDTSLSPVEFQRPERTPTLGTLNAQITRVFSPKFEVYVGGENITNVRQDNPIISSDNPFGSNFDTNFVYGPIFGSMFYAGLRYRISPSKSSQREGF